MNISILLTEQAINQLSSLKDNPSKKAIHKAVSKTIRLMQSNLRHPSLNTHKYTDYKNPFDSSKSVFESYAQNKTPGAYRIFWVYGPDKEQITIIAITPHP